MLFNSVEFIFIFLPASFGLYAVVCRWAAPWRKAFLLVASAVFYAQTGIGFAAYLCFAVVLNYFLAGLLDRQSGGRRESCLVVSLLANVGILAVAKYHGFFIDNVNCVFSTDWQVLKIVAPIGISFFTFSFVAYAVDLYRREIGMMGVVDYALYVVYFPKLLMGPIVGPGEFSRQLMVQQRICAADVAHGFQLFVFGLFKKAVIADALVPVVAYGFDPEAWHSSVGTALAMLSYTFEIYFDFSGYTDMAMGVSKLFGIGLPANFDSPYHALSVRDFWKRWHLTLTGFLTKYIYFPLGGSRCGTVRTYANILIVFLVSGLWHGANWTFVLWGILHGLLMVRDRIMERADRRVPIWIRWCIMFGVTNVLWALFRSADIGCFVGMMRNLLRFTFGLDPQLTGAATGILPLWALLLLSFGICLWPTNNARRRFQPTALNALLTAVLAIWSVCSLGNGNSFVYFNF